MVTHADEAIFNMNKKLRKKKTTLKLNSFSLSLINSGISFFSYCRIDLTWSVWVRLSRRMNHFYWLKIINPFYIFSCYAHFPTISHVSIKNNLHFLWLPEENYTVAEFWRRDFHTQHITNFNFVGAFFSFYWYTSFSL